MANEDTVLQEAMDNLKEAGQRIRASAWLTGPEYATLRHRLEDAHAAAEAELVEARRRVRLNERQVE